MKIRACMGKGYTFTKRQNLDRSEFKAFVDDKMNMIEKLKYCFG